MYKVNQKSMYTYRLVKTWHVHNRYGHSFENIVDNQTNIELNSYMSATFIDCIEYLSILYQISVYCSDEQEGAYCATSFNFYKMISQVRKIFSHWFVSLNWFYLRLKTGIRSEMFFTEPVCFQILQFNSYTEVTVNRLPKSVSRQSQ